MSVELATAYVSLIPSFRGGTAALDREASKMGKSTASAMSGELDKAGRPGGSLFRTFAGIAAGATAVFAGAKLLGGFLSEAQDAQKVGRQTEAVLKSTGGAANVSAKDVDRLATALSKKAGVDDEVIASGENVLATFTKVANQAGKGNNIFDQATGIALDMSKALGTDLQGSVIQVGKALNDPIKGITALQRVGVSFTQQQKDQIKTLVESGDTLGAQKIILGELNTEFGGMAESSATTGDKLRVMWGNVQETIGTALLPAFDKVGNWLADKLPGIVDAAGKVLGNVFHVIGEAWSHLVSGFKFGVEDYDWGPGALFARIGATVREVWDVVSDVVPKLAHLIGDAIGGVWDVVSRVAHNIKLSFDIIVGAFKDPDITSSGFYGVMERIGIAARGMWEIIKDVFPKVIGWVIQLKDWIVDGLGFVVGWVEDNWDPMWDGIVDGIGVAVDWVQTHWPAVRDTIVGVLKGIVDWVANNWRDIKDDFVGVFNGLITGVSWVIDHQPVLIGVLTAIGVGLAAWAVSASAAGIASVAAGIAAAAAWVVAAAPIIAVGVAIAAVVAGFVWAYQNVEWFRTAVDATVDALIVAGKWLADAWGKYADDVFRVLVQIGKVTGQIVQTTIDVVRGIIDAGVQVITFIWRNFGDDIVAFFRNAWNLTVGVLQAAWATISGIVQGGIDVIRGIIQTVMALIHGDWGDAWDGIKLIVYGVWEGIKGIATGALTALTSVIRFATDNIALVMSNAWQAIFTVFRTVWGALVTFFHDNVAAPIASVVSSLTQGIADAFSRAVRAVQTVWNMLVDVVKTPINLVIGFYNNGIRGVWNNVISKIPGVGNLGPVSYLNTGGQVPGGYGSKDDVPAMLTRGEIVFDTEAVKAWGPDLLLWMWKHKPTGTEDPGILGYAQGGQVRSMDEIQNFIRQQSGKPYVFPLVGPNAFDCSGFTSAVTNFALGLNPWSRRHSSGTVGSDPAMRPGGDPATQLTIGAKPPYTVNRSGDFVGHVALTAAGLNAEATPPAVRVGGNARGSANGIFSQHYFVNGVSGLTDEDRGIIEQVKSLVHLVVPNLGGPPIGDLLQRMFTDFPKTIFDFLMGKLPSIIVDAVKDAVGGFFKAITPFAGGGTITGPFTVGEHGPELYVPRQSMIGDHIVPFDAIEPAPAGSGAPLLQVGALFGNDEFQRMVRQVIADEEFKRRSKPQLARVR